MTNRRIHNTSEQTHSRVKRVGQHSRVRSTIQATLCTLAVAAFAHSAFAAGPGKAEAIKDETTLKAASLAATCANCHNTSGKGVDGAAVMGLSYLKASYIESQMLSFKRGEREATVMHQLSKGYTDEQIKIIADYLGQK